MAAFPALALGASGFTASSSALSDGARMPIASVYTACGGGNQSPPLRWRDPPPKTRSYAVTMFDPDAAGGFWHWIALDIPGSAESLRAGAGNPHSDGASNATVQLHNDFGNIGYSGPCPPPGKPHHYVISVYAMDVPQISLGVHPERKAALNAIRRHTLATANLTVTWGR